MLGALLYYAAIGAGGYYLAKYAVEREEGKAEPKDSEPKPTLVERLSNPLKPTPKSSKPSRKRRLRPKKKNPKVQDAVEKDVTVDLGGGAKAVWLHGNMYVVETKAGLKQKRIGHVFEEKKGEFHAAPFDSDKHKSFGSVKAAGKWIVTQEKAA